jgi:CRP-like cAMP-binding protein
MALARQVKSLRMHSPLVAAGSGVRGRLAALLLQLGERFGRKLNAGGLRIELQLSCELLGQMLDSHRATVNKELIELEQRGLTERVSRQIVILDEAGLRKLAENVC